MNEIFVCSVCFVSERLPLASPSFDLQITEMSMKCIRYNNKHHMLEPYLADARHRDVLNSCTQGLAKGWEAMHVATRGVPRGSERGTLEGIVFPG